MKKVLVITYYWPPAGGISVLRTLKIVKYLQNFGWEPIVYAPSNAHYPYTDDKNSSDIPDNIRVIKKPIVEPFKTFKFLTGRKKEEPLNSIVQVRDREPSVIDKFSIWVRGNFFIPDARSLWIKPSVKFLTKFVRDNQVDAIFTDGPPHTNTYIGNLLKRNTGLPWLSDYQDPWTQVDYYKMLRIGKRADQKHKAMEQECFHRADKITIASLTWARDLEAIGATDVDVVYYGYDEDDFKDLKKEKSDFFDIVHIGLLGIDRHPIEFFEVLAKNKFSRTPRLLLAGQVDIEVRNSVEKLASNCKVEILGTVHRTEALQLAKNADLLLLPLNKAENANGRLPGKLYEYLRTQNPILGLGPSASDAARIIRTTGTGECFEYADSSGQEDFLMRLMNDQSVFNPKMSEIERYSNLNQTKMVAHFLDQIS